MFSGPKTKVLKLALRADTSIKQTAPAIAAAAVSRGLLEGPRKIK